MQETSKREQESSKGRKLDGYLSFSTSMTSAAPEVEPSETFVELYKYNVDTSWKTAYFFFWSFDLKCTIKSLFISFIYLLNFISYSQSKIKVHTKYCIWERVSLQVF